MSKSNILLVDDEEEYVQTLAERLRLKGFAVEVALNGEEALQRCAARGSTPTAHHSPADPAPAPVGGPAGTSPPDAPTDTPAATEQPRFNILLVDDEQEYVQTLAERLRLKGFAVEVAFSGQEALVKVQGSSFQVVILDYAMPGLNGVETLKQLRQLDPRFRFLLLTGQATITAATEATRLGAVDILEKPTDLVTLMERINVASASLPSQR